MVTRCSWPLGHEDYLDYHDNEWGRPVVDDTRYFWELRELVLARRSAANEEEAGLRQ